MLVVSTTLQVVEVVPAGRSNKSVTILSNFISFTTPYNRCTNCRWWRSCRPAPRARRGRRRGRPKLFQNGLVPCFAKLLVPCF